jgi:hypothetical protein
MENSTVMFKVGSLKNFKIINEEGRNTLKVRNVVRYNEKRIADVSEAYSHSYIINYEAIEQRKLNDVLSVVKGKDSVAAESLNNLLFAHVVHVNKGQKEPSLPMKGEKVRVLLAYALDKEGQLVFGKDSNGEITEDLVLNVRDYQVDTTETSVKSLADFMEEPIASGSILKEAKETIKA